MRERRKTTKSEHFYEDERQFQLVVHACAQAIEILEAEDKERLLTLLLWQPPFDLLRSTLDSFTAGNASGKVKWVRVSNTEAKVKSTTVNEMKRAWSQVIFHFQFPKAIRDKFAQSIGQLETLQQGEQINYLNDFARAVMEFVDPGVAEKAIKRVGLDQSAEIITSSKTPLIGTFGKITEYLWEIAGEFGFSLEPPTALIPQS